MQKTLRPEAVPISGAREELVRIEGLSRTFDLSDRGLSRILTGAEKVLLRAVDDVNLNIRRGETYALVGESGSGKSTIAKMVVGLLNPTQGRVLIDSQDIRTAGRTAAGKALRRRIQMVFQDPYASLHPRQRIARILEEPMRAFGLHPEPGLRAARVRELLETVGLDPRDAVKYPHQFSGGQRQRIAIARALASEPEFIICDEPTSALDVSVQAQVLNLLRDLQRDMGLTYLFISHDLAVVRHMASRIGVLYLGRLVEEADAGELFAAPRHPYTVMLLDSVPDIRMRGRDLAPIAGEVPSPIAPPSGCHYHPRCPNATDQCLKVVPALTALGNALVRCVNAEP